MQKVRPIADIEGLKVEVKEFRLTGLTVMDAAEAQTAVAPYLGPDRKFQDLLDAAAALRKVIASKGYFLADVVIPEQAIKDGTVELLVLEGRMGKVRIEAAADVGMSAAYLESFVSSLQEGALVDTRTVERAVFLLSDLKGISVRTVFEPGAKTGTANLVVQVKRSRTVEGNIDVDANGSIYTGVLRGGGGVDFNNLAGIGDMLSLRVLTSLEGRGLSYSRFSYLTPAGSSGLKLGYAYSDMQYRLGTPTFEPIKASGRANIHSAIAALPLIRSRNMNTILSGQFDLRGFRDRKDATTPPTLTDKNSTVTTLGIGGDVRDALFGGGISIYNVARTEGKLAILSTVDLAADRAGHRTNGKYHKTNFSFSRLQSLAEGLALYLTYGHQTASKNLDSSEKFSLGGVNGVRAYPQGEASGDEGWLGNAELRWRVPTGDSLPGTMVLTAFHDAGWSRLNKNMIASDTTRERKIAGIGFGVNWEVPSDWSFRGSIATPQTDAPLAEHVKRNPRIYLQFSKTL